MTLSPEMWKMVISQGIFAVLFVMLLCYVLARNDRRERTLMTFVESVTPIMQRIQDELCDIKSELGMTDKRGK